VELTVHFKCNLKCVHCMIEGTMDWAQAESADDFERNSGGQPEELANGKGLILTGSR